MRTKNASRNVGTSLLLSILAILVGFIAQRVFINTLGTEYLGINGLFTNIVSMLALAELGLGSAIYYHLYKPLAEADNKRVKSLIQFYKIGYRYVALAVLLLSLCIVPFLGMIVGPTSIPESIYLIYTLFVIDIICSYLLTYKRSVIYADQKNYIISLVHHIYFVVMNILQIGILLMTKNFYLYLIIKITMRLVENVALTVITDRLYPYLKDKKTDELDDETKKDIFKKVRGLSFHKMAGYIVKGTDNIIISIFFGVGTVGLYSNYFLVTNAVNAVMDQAYNALTSSVGNLLIDKKHTKSYEVYKKAQLMTFWLSCLISVSLFVTMDSFITLWIGSKYLLGVGVLAAISINLYFTLMRENISSFKEAAGIFHEDKHIPVIEAILNITLALIFLHFFGLAGVFMGTIGSTLLLHLYSYPKYVYKPLFKQGYRKYFSDFTLQTLLTFVIGAITFAISRSIPISGRFAQLVFNVALCLIIPNFVLYIVFRKSEELSYYLEIIKGISGKIFSHEKV